MIRSKLIAILIILTSIVIAAFVLIRQPEASSHSLAVQVIASGGSIALSWLLVSLYDEQRRLLERQLDFNQRPEVYIPPDDVEWRDDGIEFDVHNDGQSAARRLRVVQEINIHRTGKIINIFGGLMTPKQSPDDHSAWTPGESYIKPGENRSIRVYGRSVEMKSITIDRVKRRLLGLSPRVEEYHVTINWFLEYGYTGEQSDRVKVVSDSFRADDQETIVEKLSESLPAPQIVYDEDNTVEHVQLLCGVEDVSPT